MFSDFDQSASASSRAHAMQGPEGRECVLVEACSRRAERKVSMRRDHVCIIVGGIPGSRGEFSRGPSPAITLWSLV